MAITVIKESHANEAVDFETAVSLIETGRDRVRTIGNMILTVAGISLSATLAFLLFLFDKLPSPSIYIKIWMIGFGISACASLISVMFSISSAFLRGRYAMTTKMAVLSTLSSNLSSELRLVRVSFFFLAISLLLTTVGMLALLAIRW